MPEFTMPSLGADMDSGTLVEWLVEKGDRVRRGDPIAVVDTDKSAIEVESFDDGVVEAFLVEPGTRVAVGTPLARLAPLEGAATPPAVAAAAPPEAAPTPSEAAPTAGPVVVPVATPAGRPAVGAPPGPEPGRVSPYARRLARDLGVDLTQIQGSGADGSVHAEDVLAARSATIEEVTEPTTPTPEQPVREEPEQEAPAPEQPIRTTGRETIAALMSRAKREIPHYYVATTVDLHVLVEWLRRTNRERTVGDRIVPAAAVLKATALAAREHPELNGFWVDGAFVAAEDVHLGVAVHVRGGALVAPAIHHTADLDLPAVMAALRDLVSRARSGRLRRAELADPTLTVSDLGDQGVEEVIGVIYPPQVALLGVGKVVERPWAVDGLVGVRPTVRLTLSGDHRATDGATGARFLTTLEQLLQHPEEL
ncbi:MAG TPA: dihydrolipoamide acetyltransferase family protein [Nocardioidaceae bacterium]